MASRDRRKRKTATAASDDEDGSPTQRAPRAAPGGGGGGGGGGGAGTGAEDGHGSAEVATGDSIHLAPGFITKTFAMVMDKGNAAAIKWGRDGTSIVIGQVRALWVRSGALGGGRRSG